jgi:hypothetical protein
MSRVTLCSAGSLIALLLTLLSPDPWALAQPPAAANPDAPNPLDLARGLREQGMADLALEYLQDLIARPTIPDSVKDQIPLERAKCQLDAAVDEPDEGTRISLIGEAKEGFFTFVRNPKNASHARMPEAFLSLARLTSMDAKAQLGKARRMDVPQLAENSSNSAEVDDAKKRQKEEAAKARPLFKAASDQLKSAIGQLRKQLDQNPAAAVKKSLHQTLFEAELARGTNELALAETFISPDTMELGEKTKIVDEAQSIFSELIRMEGAPASITGVARAWVAECYNIKVEYAKAEEEEKRIDSSTGPEAEEAKRMVRFFRLRRAFLSALGARNELPQAAARCREWLRLYGNVKRAQTEAFAVRWYLGYTLELEGNALLPPPPKVPPKTPQPPAALPPAARIRYQEAEKLFRLISQSDNDYTQRASRERMYVVRRLLGEADQPPSAYRTFEECQMASLIQMARAYDLQKADPEKNKDEVKARQHAIVALLERARELATPQDNPADVADVNIRLIEYYRLTDQPYQAAVLGDHIARTTKTPGGKSALAGALGLIGYSLSTYQVKNVEAEKLDGIRKTDRDLAIRLAQYIDKTFPNDTATDRARHRLAGFLYEDQKPVEAYDALLKVRPGYEFIASARLLQGAIAYQLLLSKDSPLAENRRRDVFRRTTADLDKLVKPLTTAPEEDVRPYLTARWRLALLYNLEPRVDPEGNKIDPGYAKSRKVAEETLASIPSFHALIGEAKALNLDGWELRLQAEDARARAAVLEGTTLFAQGKLDEAYKAIGDLLADMNRSGPFVQQV